MDFDNTEAVDQLLALPQPTPKPMPKTSAWSAPWRAVKAGAAEAAATVGELVKGYGQVAGAMGDVSAGGMFSAQSPKERAESEAARQDLLQHGVKGGNEVSRSLRNVAADLRPDPVTASTAESLVFDLTKGLTKAVGAVAALGPVGGAVGFGVDEGAAKLDELQRQGVDDRTALAVAGVTGIGSAAGLLLPVGGSTVGRTVGLTLAGGPTAFVAQQAATRAILDRANYGEIAKQYDPLDPAGLAVATLIPAAFGGLHIAGMRAGTPRPVAAGAMPPDGVDAAMVHNLTLQRDLDATHPAPRDDSLPPLPPEVPGEPPAPAVGDAEPLTVARRRADAAVAAKPDLAVHADGDRSPLARDELERMRQEAKEGTDEELGHADADLVRVAAECFLTL